MPNLFAPGVIAGRLPRMERPPKARIPDRTLPEHVARFYAWQERAACHGRPELFFGPDGERVGDRARRESAAKLLCGSCPVREACFKHAVSMPEGCGAWGGTTEEERDKGKRQAVRDRERERQAAKRAAL